MEKTPFRLSITPTVLLVITIKPQVSLSLLVTVIFEQ